MPKLLLCSVSKSAFNSKIMNAKEARQKAEQLVTKESQDSINAIEKLIEQTVNKGGFQCNYYKNVTEVVKDYFEKQGFAVKYQDEGRNEFSYKFSW